MAAKKLYVIGHSHIDPVWIWRRRYGRSEWNNTCWSVVRLMKDNPDVRYSCPDSSLYSWIEESDPALFKEIAKLVEAGRWEVVGGWVVQSDAIIASGESLIRQAEHGKKYIFEKFGVDVKVAFNPDAFGHTADLPKILKLGGFKYFSFSRPSDWEKKMPHLFNWKSNDGSKILCARMLGGYGQGNATTRESFLQGLDWHIKDGAEDQAFFFGVGDHGGGIFREHLKWLREAMKTREIVFSTLEDYFKILERKKLPEVEGELSHCFRGCYSSCHFVKSKVARGKRMMIKAEKLLAAGESNEADRKTCDVAWEELLFNHFHDILPGSSVRDAYELDVNDGLGHVGHAASALIDRQLMRIGASADCSFMKEGGVLLWNPQPFPIKGVVSYDDFEDPNNVGSPFSSLEDEAGKAQPIQFLPPATSYGPCGMPWGRITAVVDVPASGYKILGLGRKKVKAANLGFKAQRELLERIVFEAFRDHYSTWGHNMNSYGLPVAVAKLEKVLEAENGPVVSRLRAVYSIMNSQIALDVLRYAGIDELELKVRLDWNDEGRTLKLALKSKLARPHFFCGHACGMVERPLNSNWEGGAWQWSESSGVPRNERFGQDSGEVSMIDWSALCVSGEKEGFYSEELRSCDFADGKLRITLNRPTLYSNHEPFEPRTESGWMDMGRSWRTLWHFNVAGEGSAPELTASAAAARLDNAEACPVTCHPGKAPSEGEGLSVDARETTLESVVKLENGKLKLRFFNHAAKTAKLSIKLGGKSRKESIAANAIKEIVL